MTGPTPPDRVVDSRRRAAARQRALSRLAREHFEQYRRLYREELGRAPGEGMEDRAAAGGAR